MPQIKEHGFLLDLLISLRTQKKERKEKKKKAKGTPISVDSDLASFFTSLRHHGGETVHYISTTDFYKKIK